MTLEKENLCHLASSAGILLRLPPPEKIRRFLCLQVATCVIAGENHDRRAARNRVAELQVRRTRDTHGRPKKIRTSYARRPFLTNGGSLRKS
jgi:hypothetical protein